VWAQQKSATTQKSDAAQPATVEEVERGKRLLAQGDAVGAVASLKSAAERRKTDADAWYYLGLALSRADRAKDARKAFEKAIKLRPDAAAHTGLAYALLLLDKPRDAEREAERALALDTNHAEAHYVLAAVNFRGDKLSQAAAETDAALRLKPDFPAAAILSGSILLKIYVGETVRIAEQYPIPSDANEESRKPVLEKRDAALEPVKVRMRAAADQLETLVKIQPGGGPAATNLQEMADMLRVYGGGPSRQPPSIFRQAEVTTKALITFKPEPGFTEKARQKNVTGVVRLRAVLAADGRVKYILVIKGLPYGLTEKAIAAASQIRFTPATVEGQPVSQFVVLEYNFNIY
jgi:TonB family protein